MYDIVIRNGMVFDGTGATAFLADVAIDGDSIAAIGKDLGPGRRELDAGGKMVTPGFVDMHTHFDAQVTWDPYLTPSSWHGVTTVVMGNCGVGFAPVRPDRHDFLIRLMEGVEDIPGAAMHEGIDWRWESFPEYLDAIEDMPHAIDFGAQVTHGAVRAYVMDERGADNEVATTEDIKAMSAIVKEAVAAGALGFSTSRTLLHKSIDGRPVPGTFATAEELFGIGRALGELQMGVFQLASEHLTMGTEFEWMKVLAAEIDRPVLFNLSQADQAPVLYKELLTMLEEANSEGVKVLAQCAGRAIGIVMCWEGTAHPFLSTPAYMSVHHLPVEERLERLRDPALREAIINDTHLDFGEFANFVTQSHDKMYVGTFGDKTNYEPDASMCVQTIAERTGTNPKAIIYDALMERDGRGMIYFPLFNYSDGDLEVLHELHNHPHTRMGLSDAGAHCGAICDGGMPTFMLTHWGRDRTRGPRIPLETLIMRQTRQTAEVFGLLDRGVLKPGYKADVNIIDFDALRFERPEMVYDLPAGGKRLVQRAEGYVATICSGQVIVEDGRPTGAMPGKLVRGAQVDPKVG